MLQHKATHSLCVLCVSLGVSDALTEHQIEACMMMSFIHLQVIGFQHSQTR